MSELVLDALRVLGPAPPWTEVELVAEALRGSTDPEIVAMLDNWEHFIALVQERDVGLQFTGLDLYSEVKEPGGKVRAMERGRPVEE
jgi:hypothetical protein